jgi:hypothetical protein
MRNAPHASAPGAQRASRSLQASVLYMLCGTENFQTTLAETVFTAIVMLLGAILAGVMVSQLSVQLQDMLQRQRVYSQKMEHVTEQCSRLALPQVSTRSQLAPQA